MNSKMGQVFSKEMLVNYQNPFFGECELMMRHSRLLSGTQFIKKEKVELHLKNWLSYILENKIQIRIVRNWEEKKEHKCDAYYFYYFVHSINFSHNPKPHSRSQPQTISCQKWTSSRPKQSLAVQAPANTPASP